MKNRLVLLLSLFLIGANQTVFSQNIAQVNLITEKYVPQWAKYFGKEFTDEDSSSTMVVATISNFYLDSIFNEDYHGMKSVLYKPGYQRPSGYMDGSADEGTGEYFLTTAHNTIRVLTGNANKVPMNTDILKAIITRYEIDGAVPIIIYQPFGGCGKLLISYMVNNRMQHFVDQDNACP